MPSVTALPGPVVGVPEIGATLLFVGVYLLAYALFARTFPMISPRLAEITLERERHHTTAGPEFDHEESPKDYVPAELMERREKGGRGRGSGEQGAGAGSREQWGMRTGGSLATRPPVSYSPVPRSPFPVPRSPFPVPRSPFPVPRSPFSPPSPSPSSPLPFPVPHSPLPAYLLLISAFRRRIMARRLSDGRSPVMASIRSPSCMAIA